MGAQKGDFTPAEPPKFGKPVDFRFEMFTTPKCVKYNTSRESLQAYSF
jgi:hypothetical protein